MGKNKNKTKGKTNSKNDLQKDTIENVTEKKVIEVNDNDIKNETVNVETKIDQSEKNLETSQENDSKSSDDDLKEELEYIQNVMPKSNDVELDLPPELDIETTNNLKLTDAKIGILISTTHKDKYEKKYSGLFTKCRNVKISVIQSYEILNAFRLFKGGIDLVLVFGDSKFKNDCLNGYIRMEMDCVFGCVSKLNGYLKDDIDYKTVPLASVIYTDQKLKHEKYFLEETKIIVGVSTSPFWAGVYSLLYQPVIHFTRDDISVKPMKTSFIKLQVRNGKLEVDLATNNHIQCKNLSLFCHKYGGYVEMDGLQIGNLPCQFQVKNHIKLMMI